MGILPLLGWIQTYVKLAHQSLLTNRNFILSLFLFSALLVASFLKLLVWSTVPVLDRRQWAVCPTYCLGRDQWAAWKISRSMSHSVSTLKHDSLIGVLFYCRHLQVILRLPGLVYSSYKWNIVEDVRFNWYTLSLYYKLIASWAPAHSNFYVHTFFRSRTTGSRSRSLVSFQSSSGRFLSDVFHGTGKCRTCSIRWGRRRGVSKLHRFFCQYQQFSILSSASNIAEANTRFQKISEGFRSPSEDFLKWSKCWSDFHANYHVKVFGFRDIWETR